MNNLFNIPTHIYFIIYNNIILSNLRVRCIICKNILYSLYMVIIL